MRGCSTWAKRIHDQARHSACWRRNPNRTNWRQADTDFLRRSRKQFPPVIWKSIDVGSANFARTTAFSIPHITRRSFHPRDRSEADMTLDGTVGLSDRHALKRATPGLQSKKSVFEFVLVFVNIEAASRPVSGARRSASIAATRASATRRWPIAHDAGTKLKNGTGLRGFPRSRPPIFPSCGALMLGALAQRVRAAPPALRDLSA
jgi:hypothetical protein